MNKAFVIGDIHGCYSELLTMLDFWNKEEEQLIFLGDYIDRGNDSFSVVKLVHSLVQEHGAIALKGNHEAMLIDWINERHVERFLRNGGQETITSFLGTDDEPDKRRAMMEAFPLEIQFLANLPLYYEWNDFLFVHAGVNLSLDDWKKTSKKDFLWIREPFHNDENQTGKTIVFGHTPTQMLHPEPSTEPWFSACQTKIGIDGGLVFGGTLHGLKIDQSGQFHWHHIHKKEGRS